MSQPVRTSVRVTEGGRIIIPAKIRMQCGFEVGSEILMTVDDGHVTLINAQAARRRAQAIVARYIKPGTSLSEELMRERRREARRE